MDGLIWTVLGWAATSIIGALAGACVAANKRKNAQDTAMELGMRSLLRHELIEIHRVYVIEKGYCPIIVKEHAAQVYSAYHALGGNGTATHLYEEIQSCKIGED